jgi:hypothetical protein
VSATFCRLDITVQNRPVRNVLGDMVQGDPPLRAGAHIFHWADPARAIGWFQEAKRLLNDNARLASINAPKLTNINENKAQAAAQFQYMLEVVQAIARGYNQLNIVWWNDPAARDSYRTHVSGPPAMFGQNINGSMYTVDQNYNDKWYSGSSLLPKVGSGLALQHLAASLNNTSPGTSFFISSGLLLSSYRAQNQDQFSDLSNYVYNVPMVRMMNHSSCPTTTGFPWRDQCKSSDITSRDIFNLIDSGQPRATMPDGKILNPGFDDWRASYYGNTHSLGVSVSAPLASYLPFFSEIVNKLLARTPAEIIQDSRAFVIYTNKQTVDDPDNGGLDSWNKLVSSSSDIERQMHMPSTEVSFAATGVAAVGSAFGPVGALIGGAVAAVITVANVLVVRGVSGHGRDDLGRYKLQFERAWLSGNPVALAAADGAPILPPSELADPPGGPTRGFLGSFDPLTEATWHPLTPTPDGQCYPANASSAGTPGTGSGTGSGWAWAAGIAAAIGIGYVVMKRKVVS